LETNLSKILGEGGYGEVILATWNATKVALKKLKSTTHFNDLSHEAKTLVYVSKHVY